MARQPYTTWTYHLDQELLDSIEKMGLDFNGTIEEWAGRWYETGVRLCKRRTPNGQIYLGKNVRISVEDASPAQIRLVLQKYVQGAPQRMQKYLDNTRPQGNIETLFGDEAEIDHDGKLTGYCGCLPILRFYNNLKE